MSNDKYLTNGDKPYAENLNDSLLLVDAFHLNVYVALPGMYKDGEFNNTTGIVRKAGVSLVTITNKDAGVTIGSDSITGTGKITFRVYPNFNSFDKWSKVAWSVTSGSATVDLKETDGTTILSNIGNFEPLSSDPELSQLQEIDVVITLTNATITKVVFEFVNKKTRTGNQDLVHTTLLQSNVDSLTTDLASKEAKANKKDTINDSSTEYPSSKAVTNGLALKENLSNKKTSVTNSDSDYPTGKAVTTALSSKEDTSNKKTTITNSDTYYPSSSAVYPIKQIVDSLNTWTETFNQSGVVVEKNSTLGLARVKFDFTVNLNTNQDTLYTSGIVPVGSRPSLLVRHVGEFAGNHIGIIYINSEGEIYVRSDVATKVHFYGYFMYSIGG